MNIKPLVAAIVSVGCALSFSAHAYQQGDLIFRGGAATVAPDASVSSQKGALGPASKADVNNNTQLGLSFTYMVADNFGVEVLAATPFKHKLKAKGDIAGLGTFAEVKHLPPTVSFQYYPMNKGSAFQPYAGVGINYTYFFDEKVKVDGFKDVSLDSSLGLTAQLGFDYMIDSNWSINAAVWYMDINTELELKHNNGDKSSAKVELDPWVYMVGVGYKF